MAKDKNKQEAATEQTPATDTPAAETAETKRGKRGTSLASKIRANWQLVLEAVNKGEMPSVEVLQTAESLLASLPKGAAVGLPLSTQLVNVEAEIKKLYTNAYVEDGVIKGIDEDQQRLLLNRKNRIKAAIEKEKKPDAQPAAA